ncbi:UDP-sugar diphosphatase [Mytilus galloprovincialis]|uniref:Uridine diphosphate glucose pyrophosphatase NUDT14 n=1 Tax=Mytilus galloprovincialis TaxID=29158 RepID=A0A8B6DCC2_MYTGA|nr:UDP-sugar diphosphatase [Mytilus galloprovincialis]
MDKISDVTIADCEKSTYIKPLRLTYQQNLKKKTVDLIWDHEDVVILIYNVTRHVLVFVKQFRPAVYLCSSKVSEVEGQRVIKHEENPPNLGLTYELCAGIVDKDTSLEQIAQGELLEECGYKVPLDKLERMCSCRGGVGTSGALQTMYFAEVTDAMRVSQGGGVKEEGEMIDVVDIPVSEAMDFAMDDNVNKPVGMMFAVLWFFQHKNKHYSSKI